LVFGNIPDIFAAFFKELASITIREMWGLESRLFWQSLGLEVWARSRRLRSRLHHCLFKMEQINMLFCWITLFNLDFWMFSV